MQLSEEDAAHKNGIKKAIYLFIAVMLFLTFFSRTINNFMLPRVKTATPREGTLVKEVRAEGIVEGKETYYAYARDSFQVKEIKVQVGESVNKGQLLMVLDTGDLKRQLSDEQTLLAQKKVTLELLRTENEREIAAARDDLNLKRRNEVNAGKLYEIGAESKVDWENSRAELRTAERAYDAALGKGDRQTGENNLKIQNARLDIQLQQSKVDAVRDELKTVNNLAAPADGVITGLNCAEGSLSDTSKPLYALTSRRGGFELKVKIDSTKADYFALGDEVEVSIPSSPEGQTSGVVRGINRPSSGETGNNQGDEKEVIIDIQSSTLMGGEHGEVHFKKETRRYEALIPNEAVRKENNKPCVFIVKEKDGALGKEYYIKKIPVYCADSDDSQTAVSKGLYSFDQVACSSDKAINDGDRVRLAADNDSES